MLSMGQMTQRIAKLDMMVGKILHELKRETDTAVALAKATSVLEQLQQELEGMKD